MASRWANDEADRAEEQRRKKEKEEKKRLKLQKQQQEAEAAARVAQEAADSRPAKRRRLSTGDDDEQVPKENERQEERTLLRFEGGGWTSCRHTSNFETLNHIEEGSYGWVSRARDISSNTVVALKKVKMDYKQDGFPITALREISILQRCRHNNIVNLHEIVSGDDGQECVLVMEFVEHDLKTLQEDMSEPFMASEVKTLLRQLVSGVGYLHENFIMHRDLKTSNILLNNRGQVKIADFGMARYMAPSNAPLTQLVVTLWYRAPELLLGTRDYGTEVDMWSVGCIFGELLAKEPLLQGKNEVDELSLIFSLCGLPSEKTWPEFYRLPNAKSLKMPRDHRNAPAFNRAKFPFLTASGVDLLSSLLALNPECRPTAKEVLAHGYFKEQPKPKPTEMFPTFPSKAGQERRRKKSPNAPKRGEAPGMQGTGHLLVAGYPSCRSLGLAEFSMETGCRTSARWSSVASGFGTVYTIVGVLPILLVRLGRLGRVPTVHDQVTCGAVESGSVEDHPWAVRDRVRDREGVRERGDSERRGDGERGEGERLGDGVGDLSRDGVRDGERAGEGEGMVWVLSAAGAAIAKSFNDKSDPKKVISEGIKVNGVKYMTIEASDDALKAKKVPSPPLPPTPMPASY
ncbi:cyclin-dependent kinase G-1 [Bipolaris maydis]|nr:cyclin-dependent kinase G-1 [Bipolaris maydis]